MDVWENLYRHKPRAFRFYPNEEFIRILGREFLTAEKTERGRIRILEVGCGNGANLWPVAKEGFGTFGVDGAPTAIQIAREIFRTKWNVAAELALGDFRQLPFRDEVFDGVFEVRALEYVSYTEHWSVCSEVLRVLRPGGKFFSFHVGKESWDYTYGGGHCVDRHTFNDIPNPEAIFPNIGLICMPDRSTLTDLFKRTGFSDIQMEELRKSYDGGTRCMQYWVTTCVKSE
jgi:SAM-dependent methyltransferase